MIVVDCLDDPDETLKRKTLDLLYKMTNPTNVVFISNKLMESLRSSTDEFLRTELVSRITELAERYMILSPHSTELAEINLAHLTTILGVGMPQTTSGSSRP